MEENTNNQPQQPPIAPGVEAKASPKVSDELSSVASNPKQNMLIIAAGIIAALVMVYNIFTGDDKGTKNTIDKVEKPKIVTKPTQQIDSSMIGVMPALPKAPELKDPSAPPPPQVLPTPPALPKKAEPEKSAPPKVIAQPVAPPITKKQPDSPLPPKIKDPAFDGSENKKLTSSFIPKAGVSTQDRQKKIARQKSTIMLLSGVETKTQEQLDQDKAFKKRNDLEYVLAKGKIIDAVIETAINTDFPGEIRAVIARDVFSESGKVILVPKGSRVFGNFASGVDALYGRISIKWERIDLPTGYTLSFDATGIDNLGRKGAQGRLDTKVKEKLSNAILSTALNVAFATAVDKLVPPEQSESQTASTQGQATGIQTAVQAVYNDQTLSPAIKIAQMCTAARGAVDSSSSSYTQVNTACQTALTSPQGQNQATADSLYNSLMQVANTSLAASSTNSTPTKAQDATKKGMEDFTKSVTDIMKQTEQKPTITIDQGTVIKIYVNKDYTFPRSAITKSRLLQ